VAYLWAGVQVDALGRAILAVSSEKERLHLKSRVRSAEIGTKMKAVRELLQKCAAWSHPTKVGLAPGKPHNVGQTLVRQESTVMNEGLSPNPVDRACVRGGWPGIKRRPWGARLGRLAVGQAGLS
jgi:hypothetical protein